MNSIREKNSDKEISIVVEYMVGNVRDTIQYMVSVPHATDLWDCIPMDDSLGLWNSLN